jgi:hypothetical protein
MMHGPDQNITNFGQRIGRIGFALVPAFHLHQQCKFLAANAGGEMRRRAQRFANHAQDLVADLVAIAIIDPLEEINVDNREMAVAIIVLVAFELALEGTAIVHHGQSVGIGEHGQLDLLAQYMFMPLPQA